MVTKAKKATSSKAGAARSTEAKATEAKSTKNSSAKTADTASKSATKAKRSRAPRSREPKVDASAAFEQVLGATNPAAAAGAYGDHFLQERSKEGGEAAALVLLLAEKQPELLIPLVDKLTTGITMNSKRIAQASADALPAVTRVAPARVAKHLDKLKISFGNATQTGQDGLVRTFAALCTASVAYQKRLEPVLTEALRHADGKMLLGWTETVLPALKGEPHARARAVVEERLDTIPRPLAQKIADFLGIKLRPQVR